MVNLREVERSLLETSRFNELRDQVVAETRLRGEDAEKVEKVFDEISETLTERDHRIITPVCREIAAQIQRNRTFRDRNSGKKKRGNTG